MAQHPADPAGKGTGEPPWKPEEMGPNPENRPEDAGAAGEARPKARPSDDRERTEAAAGRQHQENQRDPAA